MPAVPPRSLVASFTRERCRQLGTILLGLAVLALVASCDSAPTGPALGPDVSLDARMAALELEPPFYYYRGEKVFLEPVPGRFVVDTELADAEPAANEALAELELSATVERRLHKGHQVLAVAGARAGEAREVAKRLHDHPAFSFASPVYRSVGHGREVIPFNTLIVMFEAGTTASEIEALNEEFGTTVEREPVPGKWPYHILRYPKTGERDVLAIAAAFYEHPATEWADPNKLTERTPSADRDLRHAAGPDAGGGVEPGPGRR